jgi:hypothetical protein
MSDKEALERWLEIGRKYNVSIVEWRTFAARNAAEKVTEACRGDGVLQEGDWVNENLYYDCPNCDYCLGELGNFDGYLVLSKQPKGAEQ